MRPEHAKHYTSLLGDFMEDFALFLATATSKTPLGPAFSSSVTWDLTKQAEVRSILKQ